MDYDETTNSDDNKTALENCNFIGSELNEYLSLLINPGILSVVLYFVLRGLIVLESNSILPGEGKFLNKFVSCK